MIEVDPVNEATPVFAATYSSPNPDVDEDAAVGTEVVDVCGSNSDYLSEQECIPVRCVPPAC